MRPAPLFPCLTLLLALALPTRAAHAADGPPSASPPGGRPALWLYYPTNLQAEQSVAQLEVIWKRAAAAGYTHVLLADSKLAKLADVPAHYFANTRRVKQLAAELKLQVVPAVFPVGYSNELLWHDPNLAEGLPVRDQLFVVHGGEARLAADPPVAFGRPSFVDPNVKLDGNTATVRAGGGGPARFVFKLALPPYRCYHVSVSIRARDLRGQPEIKALAGEWSLNWKNLGVKTTQDWTRHDVVFNSLDHKEVAVYFGLWAEPRGELEWKDWRIEEVGLLNVLRRPGAPCGVKDDQTGRPYVEGKDYQPISDPRLGNDPWPGAYPVWHEPPIIRTRLPEGTRLRVSWYHPVVIYDEQVSACISEPKTMQLLADQARRVKELWGVPLYMMSHDEFRTCNFDEACQSRHLAPGQMLADNVRQCAKLLRPQRAAVWSDMFDPFHNAVKGPYFLVNGPWTGSWEGLEKDVLVVNWNYDHRDESLKFFADRGHQQVIAGFYDADLGDWRRWLASAAKVKGVVGHMYTSWRGDYSKMEEFARLSRQPPRE